MHLSRLFGWMTPGEFKHFPLDERDAAVAWAAGTEPAARRSSVGRTREARAVRVRCQGCLTIRDAGYGRRDGGIKIVSHSSTVADEEIGWR